VELKLRVLWMNEFHQKKWIYLKEKKSHESKCRSSTGVFAWGKAADVLKCENRYISWGV
jgi:hypothetical protein